VLAEVDLRSADEDGLALCVGAAIACTATTATGLRQREKANRIGAVRCSSERPQGKLTRIPGSQVTSHGPVRAKAVPLRPAKPTDPMWATPLRHSRRVVVRCYLLGARPFAQCCPEAVRPLSTQAPHSVGTASTWRRCRRGGTTVAGSKLTGVACCQHSFRSSAACALTVSQ
jgi:hypothetical protein